MNMVITHTWKIVQIDTYPEKDGLMDVLFMVHWTVTGTDSTYTGHTRGTAGVTLNKEGTYIPYAELTQEQVMEWVKNSLGEEEVTRVEANIAQQIADQANPPVVTLALPW